jgi:hypothetical protein
MLPFFEWCYQTTVGTGIRGSTWLFPVIEAIHLLGLGLTAGAVLTVNLRLLGVGLSKAPVAQVWAAAKPWLISGVIVMFLSGIPLFLAESIKCLYSFAFWVKMTSLFLVLVYTFTIYRRVTRTDPTPDHAGSARLAAIVSLVLWFGVAWGGRWIGFS